jgi:cytoskeletal protein RodZ
VTGWQGNEGAQDDWNQPYGPDPHPNQHGADPYAGPRYGQEPYAQADPYAQYPPPHPTGGFPAQGYGPPQPPPRSNLPMILSLVAIVIIVGAVVAIVVVNRKDSQQGSPRTQDPTSATTSETTSKSTTKTTTSERGPSTTATGGRDGWLSVDNSADSGLSYQVPGDWKKSATTRASGLDVDFTGNADYGVYDCEGGSYVRTFAASGDVQGKGGKDLDLAATVTDFAKSFATTYYGADAKVELPAPTDAKVDGETAVTTTAKVTPTVTKPACQATSGEVAIVGVLLANAGEPKGVAMLVVVNDLAGGPADPKPVPASISRDILATVNAG